MYQMPAKKSKKETQNKNYVLKKGEQSVKNKVLKILPFVTT